MSSPDHAAIHRGQDVLDDPLRNKGTAFTEAERRLLRIEGRIPPAVETIEDQLKRTRNEFDRAVDPLAKHIYLRALQDTNEVLFLRFVQENLADALPIVYTPTVGLASQEFSRIYRRPRGLFLSWSSRDRMREQIESITDPVDVIVVTDGQRILGLGDQGIGGMGIPIGKLSLYSAFGGIDPARALPVMLDVGTDNEERLTDDCYLGERSPRIGQDDYDAFVDQFVDEAKRRWPNVLLQWEDFALENATPILERHRGRIRSFNDDIQGTAAVALAALMAAVAKTGETLAQQRICILGAGSAGSGIGSMVARVLEDQGADAHERLALLDSQGVLHDGRDDLEDFQEPLAIPAETAAAWTTDDDESALETVVRHFRPTVLIGVSGVPGLFTERAVRNMADHSAHPILLPLSNPTSRSEATPKDIIRWTDGTAIVATGSPFDPVTHNGITHTISQANNVYVFPGVGLGTIASNATAVTDEMLLAAAESVADPDGASDGVLPPLEGVSDVSVRIARAVARIGAAQGVADDLTEDGIDAAIAAIRWEPVYPDIITD